MTDEEEEGAGEIKNEVCPIDEIAIKIVIVDYDLY